MLFSLIKKHDPDGIALSDAKSSLIYKELWWRLLEVRKKLKIFNISPGSLVVLQMENSLEWVLLFLGLLSLKIIIIPLSPNLTKRELNSILEITRPIKIFTSFELDRRINIDMGSLSDRFDGLWPTGDEDAVYQPTSGSTGEPKICMRTINQLILEGKSYQKTLKLTSKDNIVNVLPLYHSYALGVALMASLVSGSRLILLSNFIPRFFVDSLENEKASIVPLVPSMVRVMANTYLMRKPDLSSIRIILVGTGPVPKDVSDKIKEKYNLEVFGNYGSTETGGIISRVKNKNPDSIGVPMDGVEIIVLDEKNNKISNGQVGEIHVRAASMMRGYLGGDGNEFNSEGFFSSGDLGYIDETGHIYIVGRKKELVTIGGEKICPNEVCKVLFLLKEIKDCHVYSINRKNGESLLGALVVCDPILKHEDISLHCRKHLSSHKVPTIINCVEEIPRNEYGKAIKSKIGVFS